MNGTSTGKLLSDLFVIGVILPSNSNIGIGQYQFRNRMPEKLECSSIDE